MFYKTRIKSQIASIADDSPDMNHQVMDLLQRIYDEAMTKTRKTGESIESITYEVLEGIEEGLLSKKLDIDEILNGVADVMVDLIYDHAQENIRKSQIKKELAQEHFKEAIEKEKAHLLSSMETFQLYAHEKDLPHFEKNLHLIETKVSQKIEEIHHTFKHEINADASNS